jgi:hypothetical protein
MTDFRVRTQTERGTQIHHADNLQAGEALEMVPTEYDSRGNPRKFEIMRVGNPEQQAPMVVDPMPIVSPLPPARQPGLVTITEGSHQDRARAFGIETLQLSLVVGVMFVVASIALKGAILPYYSLALIYFGGFSLTWLAAYVLHTLRSAEGVELYSTFRLWNFLDSEQRERHRRYGQPEKRLSTGDRVFALLMLGWLGLVFLAWLAIKEGLI